MAELKCEVIVTGSLANNCYIIYSDDDKKCFIVDCPEPVAGIKQFIAGNKLTPVFIALTHGHFDHIGGLADFDLPVYIHKQDADCFTNTMYNGSIFFSAPVSVSRRPVFYSGNPINFSGVNLEVIHTPGHTPGSVSLKFQQWLFSGDALFYHSIGRTDIPRASQAVLLDSIRQRLMILPEETVVYPGHGPATTIGQEKRDNPFLT